MKDPKYLVWLDLETTGTDEKLDCILEVGTILTTPDLRVVDSGESVIVPEATGIERLMANDYVLKMHTDSGLLGDTRSGLANNYLDAQADMVEWLGNYGEPHDFMLAGSGVGHFDRRFIRTWWPDLDSWFQYPVMDVGVIRRFLQLNGLGGAVPELNEQKPHRAMADIRLHLQEAQQYRDLLLASDFGR